MSCADFITIGNEFWTSGSNEGPNCDTQKVYGWCSTDKAPIDPPLINNDSIWFSKMASPLQRCITLSFDSAAGTFKMGMKHAGCANSFPVICERNETEMDYGQIQQNFCPGPALKNVCKTVTVFTDK